MRFRASINSCISYRIQWNNLGGLDTYVANFDGFRTRNKWLWSSPSLENRKRGPSVELHPEVRARPETLMILALLQYPLACDLVSPVDPAPTSRKYCLWPGVCHHPLHLGPGEMYQIILISGITMYVHCSICNNNDHISIYIIQDVKVKQCIHISFSYVIMSEDYW